MAGGCTAEAGTPQRFSRGRGRSNPQFRFWGVPELKTGWIVERRVTAEGFWESLARRKLPESGFLLRQGFEGRESPNYVPDRLQELRRCRAGMKRE